MESGIDPGQEYYTQDYYNYDHGYELPQYGSRRKLISPSGLYDEYGEVVVDDDGSYYYSPQESEGEHGSRKRRIKLVLDREYETSSTGDESLPESHRGRVPTAHNSHVNGSIYVSQNGSIIRTRRSANATDPTTNHLKPSSPVFSSRLTKHFKKLDKMAATLEERVPLNSPDSAAEGGGRILSTFQSSRRANLTVASSSHNDNIKAVNVLNTRQSSASSGSTSNASPESAAPKTEALKSAQGHAEETSGGRREENKGESESKSNGDGDGGVRAEPLECPSDRTQSDEEELWMGPWNSLHIPMTKL